MFSGRFDHSIDEKGRVSIPAKFREVLLRENHDRLYITKFPEEGEWCLALFPPSQWDAFYESLRSKSRFERQVRAFEMVVIGSAHEIEVDRQGRILVPPILRREAHLDRDVTFSARRDHFQLWDKQLLAKILKVNEEKILDPEFLTKLGL